MLVFQGQFCATAEMNDDTQTKDRIGDRAQDGSLGASSTAGMPAKLVPPPPSAPGEFLTSQWTSPLTPEKKHRRVGEPLTPPPPSAPGEFLSAQWLDGAVPDSSLSETSDLAAFHAAVPDFVLSSSQLESLHVDFVLPGEAPPASDGQLFDGGNETDSVRLREVPLAPDEKVSLVFLPDEGLVDDVPRSGQALILTNRRIIAFRGVEGFRDTHMALSSEISQCSVRTGQRNWGAILQGLMIMVGGAFLYLIVGYWLAGQVSGPNVPVLNIDVAPLIALLIVLAGLFVLASNYFTRPAGALIFRGAGVEIAFPFRSSLALAEVYDFVDRAHSLRREGMTSGPSAAGLDGGD